MKIMSLTPFNSLAAKVESAPRSPNALMYSVSAPPIGFRCDRISPMKSIFTVLAAFILSLGTLSFSHAVTSRVGSAQDFGVGTMLGQPIGATAKYWLSSTLAVDGAMGYHFNNNFDMHADMLWHTFS